VNIALVYAAACLSAALATAVSVPFWRRWCFKSGAMDDPGHRKIHASPIPLAGGMAVMTGLVVSLLVGVVVAVAGSRSSVTGLFDYGLSVRTIQLLGLTAGALGMLLLGLYDDKSELTPLLKFGGQLVVALVVAGAGMRITLFVPSVIFSYGMTALWILTVVNAFNFMDNMNGLVRRIGSHRRCLFWFDRSRAGAIFGGDNGLFGHGGAAWDFSHLTSLGPRLFWATRAVT
jgi:UDP-GlcNAc:undecaprenyl-phosphate/decaprenyl-phosphate GlcNAc-1-phosphate transferase